MLFLLLQQHLIVQKEPEPQWLLFFYVAAILSTIRGLKNNFAAPFGANTY